MTARRTPEQVAADIEARIRSGQMPPGSRMPSQRELADEVGGYTARRAMELLASRGLVETRRGGGTVVVDVLPPAVVSLEERVAALESRVAALEGRDG